MGRKDFTVTERFFVLIGREPWSITVDNGRTIRIITGLGRVDGEFSSYNCSETIRLLIVVSLEYRPWNFNFFRFVQGKGEKNSLF